MAGTWSLQIGPEVHSGLSLFRLEALVRSGTVEGHHLVCADGKWMRVDEVPYLRRQLDLRTKVTQMADASPRQKTTRVKVGNVVHLFPDASLAMLPLKSDRERLRRLTLVGRIITVIACGVLLAEAFFLLYAAWGAAH